MHSKSSNQTTNVQAANDQAIFDTTPGETGNEPRPRARDESRLVQQPPLLCLERDFHSEDPHPGRDHMEPDGMHLT